MRFIDWFMGNCAGFFLVGLCVIDTLILIAIVWLFYQDWRMR